MGTIPATLDQVKVSEMTRADRRTVRALFLLGCNDHLLPRVDQAGGILDRRDRAFLREHDLPLADATFDELDQELQNIYSTLTRPTELLHVSYPTVSLDGSALRPAFVVERIRRLLPDVALVREDGEYRLTVPATALEAAGRSPDLSLIHIWGAGACISCGGCRREESRFLPMCCGHRSGIWCTALCCARCCWAFIISSGGS